MQNKEFAVSRRKWYVKNLKSVLGLAALALLMFIIYRIELDALWLWLSRVMLFMSVFILGKTLLAPGLRPSVTFTPDELRVNKMVIPYRAIERVQRSGYHFDLLLADRKSVGMSLRMFSQEDRAEIAALFDSLLSEKLADMAVEKDIRFTAGGNRGLEFSYSEKRSAIWFPMMLMVAVITAAMGGLLLVVLVIAGINELLPGAVLWFFLPMLAFCSFFWFLDRSAKKRTVTFDGERFNITRGGQTVHDFRIDQIDNVSIDSLNRYISFRVPACRRKEIKIVRIAFNSGQWRDMLDKINRIFYFPDKQHHEPGGQSDILKF